MDTVLFAGLVALGVFAVFASCGAVAHVPVVLRSAALRDVLVGHAA